MIHPHDIERYLSASKALDKAVDQALDNPCALIHQALLNSGVKLDRFKREWSKLHVDPEAPQMKEAAKP